MKFKILLLGLLCTTILFSVNTYAQNFKKTSKLFHSNIAEAYKNKNYISILNYCETAAKAKIILDVHAINAWCEAVHNNQRLYNRFILANYYENFIVDTKSNQKINEKSKQILNELIQLKNEFNPEITKLKNEQYTEKHITVLEKCLKISSSYFEPNYYLGHAYLVLDKPKLSIAPNLKALEIEPNSQELIVKLATAYSTIEDYTNSLTYLVKIKNHQLPYEIEALKALCYLKLDSLDLAIIHANKALPGVKNKAEVIDIKKDAEFRLGRKEDFIETLYSILESEQIESSTIEETFIFTTEYYGDSLSLIKSKQKSEEFPSSPNFIYLQLQHYDVYDKQFYTERIKLYDKLIAQNPDYIYNYQQKGIILFNMEHNEQQRAETKLVFDQILKIDSFNYSAYEHICRTYLWHDTKISKQYKALAINNMYAQLSKNRTAGDANYYLAKAYNLPTNGYGNNNKY